MTDWRLRLVWTALLLAVATVTDVRRRVIRNWTVAAAGGGSLLLALGSFRWTGLWLWAAGAAAGAIWWPANRWLRLGAGDTKLAMALGSILGPQAAVLAPALGYISCAICLLPWVGWRLLRRRPWRGVALPMAPWIALGVVLLGLRPCGHSLVAGPGSWAAADQARLVGTARAVPRLGRGAVGDSRAPR
jgi:Flp pilus assembly protein protease CpaA